MVNWKSLNLSKKHLNKSFSKLLLSKLQKSRHLLHFLNSHGYYPIFVAKSFNYIGHNDSEKLNMKDIIRH